MTQRPSKKSETLEVRISHEEKGALRDKASSENQSVSAVVRSLITSYLDEGRTAGMPKLLRSLLMFISTHPRSILLGLAAAISTAFILPTTASAENVLIAVESLELDDNGTILSSRNSAFLKEKNLQSCKYLEVTRTCFLPRIEPDLLVATFDVQQLNDGQWTIEIEVREGETVYADKTLNLRRGAGGEFKVEAKAGREVNIMAVINDDPNLKNPVLPHPGLMK